MEKLFRDNWVSRECPLVSECKLKCPEPTDAVRSSSSSSLFSREGERTLGVRAGVLAVKGTHGSVFGVRGARAVIGTGVLASRCLVRGGVLGRIVIGFFPGNEAFALALPLAIFTTVLVTLTLAFSS